MYSSSSSDEVSRQSESDGISKDVIIYSGDLLIHSEYSEVTEKSGVWQVITDYEYEFSDEGEVVKVTAIPVDGQPYDATSNWRKSVGIDSDESASDKQACEIYEYDENGRITHYDNLECGLTQTDGKGTWDYEYDNHGNLVMVINKIASVNESSGFATITTEYKYVSIEDYRASK